MLSAGWLVLAVVVAVLLTAWITFPLTRLDRLVLRFGDDEVGHHRGQAAAVSPGSRRGTVQDLEHAEHALVVLPEKGQCVHDRFLPLTDGQLVAVCCS